MADSGLEMDKRSLEHTVTSETNYWRQRVVQKTPGPKEDDFN